MNNQKQGLTELLEKVEAGQACITGDEWLHIPYTSHYDGTISTNMGIAVSAYRGSSDAAKSLHEVVLGPDWSVSICLGAAHWDVDITHYPYVETDRRSDLNVTAGPEESPARAWLIAILKAKIAEYEE